MIDCFTLRNQTPPFIQSWESCRQLNASATSLKTRRVYLRPNSLQLRTSRQLEPWDYGYQCLARAELVDETQPGDVWMKYKTTGRVHVEISFDGEACVETLTHTPEDGNWR